MGTVCAAALYAIDEGSDAGSQQLVGGPAPNLFPRTSNQ